MWWLFELCACGKQQRNGTIRKRSWGKLERIYADQDSIATRVKHDEPLAASGFRRAAPCSLQGLTVSFVSNSMRYEASIRGISLSSHNVRYSKQNFSDESFRSLDLLLLICDVSRAHFCLSLGCSTLRLKMICQLIVKICGHQVGILMKFWLRFGIIHFEI